MSVLKGTWMIRAIGTFKFPNFNHQSITGENKIEPIESCESVKILSLLRVHSEGSLSQQIDLDIRNLHAFFYQVTKFHNSQPRRS